MFRHQYSDYIDGLSTRNEPPVGFKLTCDTREYPNMYRLYKAFSEEFNIGTDQFILGNGAENVMKNALLAIRAKSMCWAVPTWTMLDVFCKALDIKQVNRNFFYDDDKNKVIEPSFDNTDCEVFYTTPNWTTAFNVQNWDYKSSSNEFKYVIVDISYAGRRMRELILRYANDRNTIIIGSFDKVAGCGMRFGFCVYPRELNEYMQLQREQFINSLAYSYGICNRFQAVNDQFLNIITKRLSAFLQKGDAICGNYITVKADMQTTIPNKKFMLGEYTFTRFGIPSNECELNNLEAVLKARL